MLRRAKLDTDIEQGLGTCRRGGHDRFVPRRSRVQRGERGHRGADGLRSIGVDGSVHNGCQIGRHGGLIAQKAYCQGTVSGAGRLDRGVQRRCDQGREGATSCRGRGGGDGSGRGGGSSRVAGQKLTHLDG